MIRELKLPSTVQEVQEMIQKREVAIDLLSEGAVRDRLVAELTKLRTHEQTFVQEASNAFGTGQP